MFHHLYPSISKTPTRTTDAPLPIWKRLLCGQTLGHFLAKLFGCVFPQPLWKPLGEYLRRWEEGEEDTEEKDDKAEEGSCGPLGASWEPPGCFLRADLGPLTGLLELLGIFLGPLGSSYGAFGPSSWPV